MEVLLSWQVLAGGVGPPVDELASRLGLRVEHSFHGEYNCEFVYFETEEDAYTLLSVEFRETTEVWAWVHVDDEPGTADFPAGAPEFGRFLALTELPPDDVVFPRGFRPHPAR